MSRWIATDLNDVMLLIPTFGEPGFKEYYIKTHSQAQVIHQAMVKCLTEPQCHPIGHKSREKNPQA